jgi:hypothetical protein
MSHQGNSLLAPSLQALQCIVDLLVEGCESFTTGLGPLLPRHRGFDERDMVVIGTSRADAPDDIRLNVCRFRGVIIFTIKVPAANSVIRSILRVGRAGYPLAPGQAAFRPMP